MRQNDPFGRIRILPSSVAAGALDANNEQKESWHKWLQKAQIQNEIQNKEDEKKAEEKKQLEKAIELKNAGQQIDKKTQQYLYTVLGARQYTHQLTLLKNLEEADLLDRPSLFKSQGAKRYRDWLRNNDQQPNSITDSNKKEPGKDSSASEPQANEQTSKLRQQRLEKLAQAQAEDEAETKIQQENNKASNKDNGADQAHLKSEQLTKLRKNQDEDKKEASQELAATEARQDDQPDLEKEQSEKQIKPEEASKNQETQLLSMQNSVAQQQKNNAQPDDLKLSAVSQLNQTAAKSDKDKVDDVDKEQEEAAESSEQKTHSNSTDSLPSALSQILGAPTKKIALDISKDNSTNDEAGSSSHPQELGAASSKAASIHALTAKELLSKTGPLGQLVEAVSKFCSKRSVNELGDWELTINVDPEFLPGTQLIACISVSELLLRFTSIDASTNGLISRHSKALCDALSKHLKRLNYPRSVEIELNGLRLS